MNRRQKKLITNLVTVVTFTVIMVAGFSGVKDIINRSEGMRAMDMVGKEALSYRENYGSLPNESYITNFVEQIGAVRLTNIQYRAQWIRFNSDPDTTILAYAERQYRGFIKSGGIVLWLNGKVEWMNKKQFDAELARQRNQQELQWLQEHLNKDKNQY